MLVPSKDALLYIGFAPYSEEGLTYTNYLDKTVEATWDKISLI